MTTAPSFGAAIFNEFVSGDEMNNYVFHNFETSDQLIDVLIASNEASTSGFMSGVPVNGIEEDDRAEEKFSVVGRDGKIRSGCSLPTRFMDGGGPTFFLPHEVGGSNSFMFFKTPVPERAGDFKKGERFYEAEGIPLSAGTAPEPEDLPKLLNVGIDAYRAIVDKGIQCALEEPPVLSPWLDSETYAEAFHRIVHGLGPAESGKFGADKLRCFKEQLISLYTIGENETLKRATEKKIRRSSGQAVPFIV
jgi:hypothetical protein